MAERGWDAELIAVNGSRDNTAEIIRGYSEKNSRLRLLENPGYWGKGDSVRNGILHSQGEILLFSDADLSSPIEEADQLLAAIADGAILRLVALAGARSADSTTAALTVAFRARFQSDAAH